jgi:hypothetical protein
MDKELREAVATICAKHMPNRLLRTKRYSYWEMIDELLTLITSDKQRLLQGLMEEAENYVLVDASPTETEIIGSERAVPIEVIQNKLEGLS